MHKIDGAGHVNNTFVQEDALNNIPPTLITDEWLNAVQEEPVNVILAAGLALNKADNTQLLQAINILIKGPADKIVRVATTAAINLNAPGANIDDAAMVAGDTFLDKDNAALEMRGIYVWNGAAVPATRDPSANAGNELFGGMIIRVKEGAANADTNWQITNDGVVTIGVTGLTFKQVGAAVSQVLPGTIIDWAGSSAPAGYLACPLSATNISRTAYAGLFAAIGTTFGAGDGVTTFGLPWFPADYASVQANANVGTNHVGENLSHTHTATGAYSTGIGTGGASGALITTVTTSANGGASNRAAGVRVLKCIKY